MRSDWPRRVTLSAGVLVSAVGAAVLIGWYARFTPLVQILPAVAPIHHTTAFSFLLSGIGLIFAAGGHRRAATLCAASSLAVAVVMVLEYVTHADFGIDRLL